MSSSNVIENISMERMSNISTNISSPNQIHEKIHVQFIRQHKYNNNKTKNLSTTKKKIPFYNEKTNSSHEDILKYQEDIKDIARHVCYYCQSLSLEYQNVLHQTKYWKIMSWIFKYAIMY